MNIHRIRRVSKYEENDLCDYCDQPVQTGYKFSTVSGPHTRSSIFLVVCDTCLAKTRRDMFWNPNPQGSTNDQRE